MLPRYLYTKITIYRKRVLRTKLFKTGHNKCILMICSSFYVRLYDTGKVPIWPHCIGCSLNPMHKCHYGQKFKMLLKNDKLFSSFRSAKNRLKYISFYTISICYHFESKTYFYWQIESYCTFERMIKGLNFGPYFKIPFIVMRPLLSK